MDYKWSALSCTSLGALIATINGGTLIIALPEPPVSSCVRSRRKSVASGTRTLVVNVGAVLSIAFAIAMVTSAMPTSVMVEIFSGVSRGLSASAAAPFISGLHAALSLMAGASIVGFFFPALRGSERDASAMSRSGLRPVGHRS